MARVIKSTFSFIFFMGLASVANAAVTPAVLGLGSGQSSNQTAKNPLKNEGLPAPDGLDLMGTQKGKSAPATQAGGKQAPSQVQMPAVLTPSADPKAVAGVGQAQQVVKDQSSVTSRPPPKPKLKWRTKRQGRALYSITSGQPFAQVTLFTGTCPRGKLVDFQQIAIDRGVLTKRNKAVHTAYATTEDGGRLFACWYLDRQSGLIRLMTESGFGEEFAKEQLDYAR